MTARGGDTASSMIFIALACWIFYQTAGLEARAAIFPEVAATVLLLASTVTLLRVLFMHAGDSPARRIFEGTSWGALALVVAAFATALFLLKPLGFPFVAVCFFLAVSLVVDARPVTSGRLLAHSTVALAFVAAVTALFIQVLGVSLPLGSLWQQFSL